MGDTEISWTHRPGTVGRTWNPVQGCQRVSEGCRNCYAERLAARFAESGWSNGLINLKTRKWNGLARVAEHKLTEPLRWRAPATVFVNSMSDLFYEGFSNEQIAAVFGVMAAAPQHTFQVLTKRATRMREWFAWLAEESRLRTNAGVSFADLEVRICVAAMDRNAPAAQLAKIRKHIQYPMWPLQNVWLGVSVENQDAADERIPELLATPAAIRFLSCEPLIGPVDLEHVQRNGEFEIDAIAGTHGVTRPHAGRGAKVDQVIAGCESGPGARPCEVEWLRSLRNQCARGGVAYFLKQAVVDLGRCGDADNPNGDRPCRQRITAYVQGPGSASYSCGCTVEGPEDGAEPAIGAGEGSKAKGGRVVELPYLDGVQHAAFPEVA